jgi:hypothetical protein
VGDYQRTYSILEIFTKDSQTTAECGCATLDITDDVSKVTRGTHMEHLKQHFTLVPAKKSLTGYYL